MKVLILAGKVLHRLSTHAYTGYLHTYPRLVHFSATPYTITDNHRSLPSSSSRDDDEPCTSRASRSTARSFWSHQHCDLAVTNSFVLVRSSHSLFHYNMRYEFTIPLLQILDVLPHHLDLAIPVCDLFLKLGLDGRDLRPLRVTNGTGTIYPNLLCLFLSGRVRPPRALPAFAVPLKPVT